jgi:hypothetical protein
MLTFKVYFMSRILAIILCPLWTRRSAGIAEHPARDPYSLKEVVPGRTVKLTGTETAILETAFQSLMGTDRSARAFQRVLWCRGQFDALS